MGDIPDRTTRDLGGGESDTGQVHTPALEPNTDPLDAVPATIRHRIGRGLRHTSSTVHDLEASGLLTGDQLDTVHGWEQDAPRTGRPVGSVRPDPLFADRFRRALRARREAGHAERPAQVEVAAELGWSVDTLQRRIYDGIVPWPPDWPPTD